MEVIFPDALAPLIRQIEAHVYANPPLAIDAARQLLKQCRQADHLAYVYEQLGFAHLILGEYRLACLFYDQARELAPPNMYVLANLAHARFELGERDAAVTIGREALRLKDELACAEAGAPTLAAPRRGALNLVSFSLYGQQARYGEMAVLNVLAARRHLPEFTCRFYLDDSVPPALVQRLKRLGAHCVAMGSAGPSMPATFWRFLAMDDAAADCVLVRDVDALIDARDAWCVRDWQQSGLAFHVMRDDCCHTELILAGMFGIRAGVIPGISALIANYLQQTGSRAWQRYGDQLFLRHALWPRIRHQTLTHDSIYEYGARLNALACVAGDPSRQGPLNNFIGANHASYRIACTLDQKLPDGMQLQLSVLGPGGTLVCRHPMQAVAQTTGDRAPAALSWQVFLPQLYAQALETGRWTHQISSGPIGDPALGDGSIDGVLLGISAGPSSAQE
ncbi:MAG: hypothetical protein RIQ60_2911 [Pseudomonadota bacterium]|jgi:hypothetical protein